jgi:beta-lactamase regulating signal transducer with metallopeptidase domain
MINKIVLFYVDGFKNLSSLGKKLWLLIIIKLVVIFVVLKVFFFPTVDTVVSKDKQADLYINQLTKVTTQKAKKEE